MGDDILRFEMWKERLILLALSSEEQIFHGLICPPEIIRSVNYLNLTRLGFPRKYSCYTVQKFLLRLMRWDVSALKLHLPASSPFHKVHVAGLRWMLGSASGVMLLILCFVLLVPRGKPGMKSSGLKTWQNSILTLQVWSLSNRPKVQWS